MSVERRDCHHCAGRGQVFTDDLYDCSYCGGFGVTNPVELGWCEESETIYSCKSCGPHIKSDSNWCAKGCGRDYNQMFRVYANPRTNPARSVPLPEKDARP